VTEKQALPETHPPLSLRRQIRNAIRAQVRRFQRRRGLMDTPATRGMGFLEHLLVDHAVFRYIYLNLHQVAPGMERAAQPSPRHIAAAAARGVKTIVNLRGDRDCASYLMEKAACEQHGITLRNYVLTSRAAPSPEQILGFDELLNDIEYPALMHCKSGADRAGIGSALYLLLRENRSADEALTQLSLRYGHIRQAKTGVLDAVIAAYQRDTAREPVDFRRWVRERYDPEAVTRSFHSSRWANFFTDRVLERE
jgi:protein tyrosine phosphatase (PTP) superfamily phosphohydrolase (DUF442 family)